ncbi:MAG: hypothetical protein MHM6MM_003450 [Cercozoa sp. M6MM]
MSATQHELSASLETNIDRENSTEQENEDPNSVRRYMLDQTDSALLFFRFLSMADVAVNCSKVCTLWHDLSQQHLHQNWRLPYPLLAQYLTHQRHAEQALLLAEALQRPATAPNRLGFGPVAWLRVPNVNNMRTSISPLPNDTRMMLVRPALNLSGQWQVDIVDYTKRTTGGYFPKRYRRPVRWQQQRLHAMTHRDDFFVDWANDRYGLVSVNGGPPETECRLVWYSMYEDHSEETSRLRMRLGSAIRADFRTCRGGKLVAVTSNRLFLPSPISSDDGTRTIGLTLSSKLRVSPCGMFLARLNRHEVSLRRLSDGVTTQYTVDNSERTVRDICIDDTGVFGMARAIVTIEVKKGSKRALKLVPITLSETEASQELVLGAGSPRAVTLVLKPGKAIPRVELDLLTGTFRMRVSSRQAVKWASALNGIDVFLHTDDCEFKLPAVHIKGSYMTPLLRLHGDELRPVLPPAVISNSNKSSRSGFPLNQRVIAIGGTCVVVPMLSEGEAVVIVLDMAVAKLDHAVPFSKRGFSAIFSDIVKRDVSSQSLVVG